ncbi:MAG: hypothetical protein IPM29_05585 [Planctomycetes bacterium]|nr:hypothetical protein [Planctomycetota bacterium]
MPDTARVVARVSAPLLAVLLIPPGCAAPHPAPHGDVPLCVATHADLPAAQRPAPAQLAALDPRPWTAAEQQRATRAVEHGFAELCAAFDARPTLLDELGENAVECFLDISYGASATPRLRDAARTRARAALASLVAPWLQQTASAARAEDFGTALTLAVYARQLEPRPGLWSGPLAAAAQAALTDAGTLSAAMGIDADDVFAHPGRADERGYELLMWSITLTEARSLDGLVLPPEARGLLPSLWRWLARYPLVDARDRVAGADDTEFYDCAYLATHIGYAPTGYGRHALRVDHAPWLYRYLRENFYPVLAMGELDLVAEFVDLFRQYGCTPATDVMVRDGCRHLLALYATAGDSFLAHRESYEDDEVDAYDLVHKAWTGIAGLRDRTPEPITPDSYGAGLPAELR